MIKLIEELLILKYPHPLKKENCWNNIIVLSQLVTRDELRSIQQIYNTKKGNLSCTNLLK